MIFYWDERVLNLITSQENLLHALQDPYSLDLFGLWLGTYTQYPIIRNGDQSWAMEFLKDYQFSDADRFLNLQGWALAISYRFLKFFQK